MWGEGLGEGRRENFFGQMFIIIPKPECFFFGGFWGVIPLQSPPFGVTWAEVSIICPKNCHHFGPADASQ